MAKKKSRKRGWSGAPAPRPGGGARPAGSTRPAGAAGTVPPTPVREADGEATAPAAEAPASTRRSASVATAPETTSNRAARKEEARRQREIIRRKEARRRALRRYGTIAGIAVVVIGLVVLLVVSNGSKGSKQPDPRSLPGISTDQAPWPPETAQLSDRIDKMGLPPLGAEATAYHIHQNLQVYVHGAPEQVPSGIGAISSSELAEIHTHDNSGTIHVEAGATRHYTLGDVFDVWGVLFTPDQLGAYKNQGNDRIRVYVAGKLVTTDPTLISLKDHEVIIVTYGTAEEVPSPIPSVFHQDQAPTAPGSQATSGPTGTSGATSTPPTTAPATTAPTTAPATSGPSGASPT